MLKIRLRRMGARNRAAYRVVVSDSRRTPIAAAVEEIGHYDPVRNPPVIEIDRERAEYWVGQGAQMSPTVKSLLKQSANGAQAAPANDETPAPKAEAKPEPKAEKAPKAEAKPEKAEKAEAEPEKTEAKAEATEDETPAEAEAAPETEDDAKAEEA